MMVIDSTNSSENDANNDMEDMSSVEQQLGPGQGQSDNQSVETDKILFADTLLKYLDKRTERGKTNYKWDGKPDQLKDFITLILKRDRQWKPKKVSEGKQMYTFTDGSEHLTLNFWQSSKTVSTQGNEKNIEKVQEKLDHLLQATKPTLVESEVHTYDNQSRTKQNEDDTVTKTSAISESKKKKNTTETEIQNLWQSVNDLKNFVKNSSINSPQNANNTNIAETSTLQTGINQLESEKSKLENELEHARILNMELIKLINNQHQIHQHSKAELEQVKSLNLIRNRNSDPPEGLKNQGEHSEKTVSLLNQQDKQNPKKQHRPQHHRKGKQIQKQSSPTGSKNQISQKQGQKAPNWQSECSKSKDADRNEESNKKKPTIIVAGDSMIKNIKGWLMSRKKQVKVCSFPGATAEEMNFFLKPLISRKPDKIILHTGTNDLSQGSVEQVSCNIIKLAEEIERNGIRCTISSIITRRGKLNEKVKQVNERVLNIVDGNLRFICNDLTLDLFVMKIFLLIILIMEGCISIKGEMEPWHYILSVISARINTTT